ncbi:cryptochrome/photolyase family protein [Pseudogemmatithrix spongiicola]|uniref:Cryptochrome/photolyase family protein n=1 Tax=Pseudogemmatithrix spongiicola TaxID=3062599 RepID=A0AA49Q5L7_9BACT|nr:cryptochrome/photolyase family protein [Gemmatimonadaceae bacterium 'strain 138']WKW15833.1 cryptochrome/photolyase family protein [Gemmatimonadaceae bacterium 'strain 318']
MRNLLLVLGDQLSPDSPLFDGADPDQDALWMAEVVEESSRTWSSKPRTALFLSAMRHYRDAARARGWAVHYRAIDDRENRGSLAAELAAALAALAPERVIVVEPGEFGVRESLQRVADTAGLPLEIRTDTHFLSTVDDFRAHAAGRKQLRMEYFYREMRKRHGVLLEADGSPTGGDWNYDAENRASFGKQGPGLVPPPVRFPPDALTREVIDLVEEVFPTHPGALADFDWPVTPGEARAALDDFIAHRLSDFGRWQDAMWTGEAWLYHSRLAAAMNLHLLDPRDAIAEAERAYRDGRAPLEAVEGFIRQILGWREYVRGIYWLYMPEYLERNAMGAEEPLPDFYWNGQVEMTCLQDAIGQTLRYGYAHHIQRLMVTGLYALLLGVRPQRVHDWYLAVYVDAVEWVELPNTLGMSQYGDGGVMASKPYVATGKYIQRMSNYCSECRYDPAEAVGDDACPFTTLYWDYLLRHESALRGNNRMTMQLKNLTRLSPERRAAIQARADAIRAAGGRPPASATA